MCEDVYHEICNGSDHKVLLTQGKGIGNDCRANEFIEEHGLKALFILPEEALIHGPKLEML